MNDQSSDPAASGRDSRRTRTRYTYYDPINRVIFAGLLVMGGIILLADGPDSNVLSFAPPFAIDDEEIGFVADTLAEIVRKIS